MSTGLVDIIKKGHSGLRAEQLKERDEAIDKVRKEYQEEGKPMRADIEMFDTYKSCDGFVEDVQTALIAMCISIVVSTVLILLLERLKLFFYQNSE